MRISNASLFRRTASVEESMMRAAMPRTSAADPRPTAQQRAAAVVYALAAERLSPALTVTLAEASYARC